MLVLGICIVPIDDNQICLMYPARLFLAEAATLAFGLLHALKHKTGSALSFMSARVTRQLCGAFLHAGKSLTSRGQAVVQTPSMPLHAAFESCRKR